MHFHPTKQNSNKNIMRSLDVEYAARNLRLDLRMGTHESPSIYFIPSSRTPSPLSMLLARPTRGFFTLFVNFPPHPRVTGSKSMCKDTWMRTYPQVSCNTLLHFEGQPKPPPFFFTITISITAFVFFCLLSFVFKRLKSNSLNEFFLLFSLRSFMPTGRAIRPASA